jgi:CDP-6-deoxy-D-xylo-4-hexulose-3-dehydrase
MKQQKIKERIHALIEQYFDASQKPFVPGRDVVQYAGAVYDETELNAMVDVMLNGWFGLGAQGEGLERDLETYFGAKKAYLTNSGSSADLLAIASLMSPLLSHPVLEDDEVITPICTFPTTISALLHNRLKPVFVDVDLKTLNPRVEDIERAITSKTRIIYLVHTLGNPNDMSPIMRLARKHKLYVVEDNCDAMGSTYKGRKTGTWGTFATESFYPAHHMTTAGEGGAIILNDLRFLRITQGLREWGRACWCGAAGGDTMGACGKRFNFKIDGIQYDHKYIFNQVGYNLKPVEIQAAMGRIQLKRLPKFIKARRKNFQTYTKLFSAFKKYFILHEATPNSDPSWFAFPITIRPDAPFNRFELTYFLETHKVQTRPLFTGNITKQPGFKHVQFKIVGETPNADLIHTNTFFVGVYPGLTKEHFSYVQQVLEEFLQKYEK